MWSSPPTYSWSAFRCEKGRGSGKGGNRSPALLFSRKSPTGAPSAGARGVPLQTLSWGWGTAGVGTPSGWGDLIGAPSSPATDPCLLVAPRWQGRSVSLAMPVTQVGETPGTMSTGVAEGATVPRKLSGLRTTRVGMAEGIRPTVGDKREERDR